MNYDPLQGTNIAKKVIYLLWTTFTSPGQRKLHLRKFKNLFTSLPRVLNCQEVHKRSKGVNYFKRTEREPYTVLAPNKAAQAIKTSCFAFRCDPNNWMLTLVIRSVYWKWKNNTQVGITISCITSSQKTRIKKESLRLKRTLFSPHIQYQEKFIKQEK